MFGKPVNRHLLGRLLSISAVGVEMVLPPIAGLAIDYKFGVAPIGLIVGVLLGFVGALIHLVILSKPSPQEREESNAESPKGTKPS